jgi:hypothetical protein
VKTTSACECCNITHMYSDKPFIVISVYIIFYA